MLPAALLGAATTELITPPAKTTFSKNFIERKKFVGDANEVIDLSYNLKINPFARSKYTTKT
ncbi:hypothetical protein GCM10007423_44370 [Dyadobacter endophyticus]|uniref:Uncharacterized protein n=1 Tax=Dyadobacter endophyticus TaxID=1749036 RepID=A0ABQ1Z2F3_9BACT|nr:hypothetical protein GCM10007423_44370 [Dyadobacter endophyticus]